MRIDIWTIAFIVILFGGGGYWMYSNIQEKKVAARVAHQKQLNEGKRVQEEKEARKSTLKLLQDLVAREEKNLQKIIEEHKIELQDIDEDAKQLSEALAAVEQKAKDGDEKARKRKQARYSPAERVLLILEDKDINDLAVKYLGEDLSAERAKFRDKVNFELRSHVEYQRKLKAISDKYYKTVSGLDARVDKLN